ncbi:fluoride efflux transporter FluC [Nocardioides litoris]|uniref:fluoride efflux transporter FluC n=1 Tax=Nocardioides litoris TaxID=1926648 RepID=UPI001B87EB8D|nr:CrcB family protein [Nocardioides litoris]
MTPRPRLVACAAAGGAVGAVLRWSAGELAPAADGFPWTTFAINVTGSLLLALLPALALARGSRAWAVALGPGVLGGFTTLSAYAEEGRALLAGGSTGTALAYLLGTLAACWVAVLLGAAATRRQVPEEDLG